MIDSRFASARSLIAYAGLEPCTSVSGDGEVKHGISHRGNANLRAILFMVARVAMVHNPVIAAFYQRLTSGEKPKPGLVALTACMAKVLRIAFAILCSGRAFDSEYEQKRASSAAAKRQADRSQPTNQVLGKPREAPPAVVLRIDAPITTKEARRRRALADKNASAPGTSSCEVKPQTGAGASATAVSPSRPSAKRSLRRR